MRYVPGFNEGLRNAEIGIAKDAVKSAALKEFENKYSDHNFSQSGQAGAVPAPDTAPLTGGAHEAIGTVIHDTVLQYVDDRTATNFNQHNAGKMSDLANKILEGGFSTNGTSYDNDNTSN